MDETWDVPTDHFTDNVKSNYLCLTDKFTDDEKLVLSSKGQYQIDISDEAFVGLNYDDGFHGWNPKCIPNIYYINWRVEQEKKIREKAEFPDMEAFQKKPKSRLF